MVASSSSEAVSNARNYSSCDPGMCLKYVRTWLEIPSYYACAEDAWYGAKHKHTNDWDPPVGAPCFWTGGDYGHISLSVGGGKVRSTDCTSSGKVSECYLDWPEDRWGHKYVGWTEDLNGLYIPWLDQEEEVAISDEDAEKIAKRVWAYAFENKDEALWPAKNFLYWIHANVNKVLDKVS